MELHGKVAVVTGAASGIGQALAERFAREGMRLVLADIEAPALDAVAANLLEQGATVLAQPCDVSHVADVEALADAAYSQYGAVHVLCNNAGVAGAAAPVWMQTLDTWNWVLGVNLMSVIYGIHGFLPRMVATCQEAHVVNTASIAGLLTGPAMAHYYATKHAVVALSESLYLDLQIVKASIGVSVLCPGFVKTRIAESSRNRPQTGDFGPPVSGQMRTRMKELIDQGMPPAEVAGQVVNAIRTGQFWILTHPDLDQRIRERADNILARRNPEMSELPAPQSSSE